MGGPQARKCFGNVWKYHISNYMLLVFSFFVSMDEGRAYPRQAKLKSGWPDLKQVPVVSWPPEKPGS